MNLALRQYCKTAYMSASAVLGDSPLFLIEYGVRLIRVVLLLSLWRLIMAGRGTVAGFGLASILAYTLIAEVFGEQLNCRIELPEALWQGTIATRLVWPMGLVAQLSTEMMGRWAVSFLIFSIPLIALSPFLGVHSGPAGFGALTAFVLSLMLAIAVGLAMEFAYGSMLVYFELAPWSLERLRSAATVIMSGSLIPLALLPWGLGRVFEWLPFASMASAPLRLYTGTGDPMRLIPLQAAWAMLLWPLAGWMWRANRQRLAGYGG